MMFKKAAIVLLGGVLVFGACKTISDNQAKTSAKLIERKKECEFQIEKAKDFISLSPSLIKLINEKTANPKLSQPSATAGYNEGGEYLLITGKLPKLDVTEEIPSALVIEVKSFDFKNKQVTVSSDCVPEPFTVNLGDLYAVFQTVDYY
ncbi:hypothetical protein [aff. Roholtiella sp. LEGE 12411]|uniref:hypothetical protein n=1 Tax=aff. Roholtiella sp. LEGE 12411 TaxID=1828822 RepID=UPI00187E097D|nr:hypothetical protein [aff. Roholtiella sp. LEGE 12411]MBE9038230.1 hypothetical protein [aff. Roholtiella sp. LEGE 12411]